MAKTAEIKKAIEDGKTAVVVWGMPHYQGREDGRWPVRHAPRSKFDPSPWLAEGTDTGMCPDGFRFNSTQIEVVR